jgi:transposase
LYEEIDQSVRALLKLSREHIVRAQKLDYALVSSLGRDALLVERLKRLRTVPGVGPITALTWPLEIGDVSRFRSIKQTISYCGLCEANSGGSPRISGLAENTSSIFGDGSAETRSLGTIANRED